MKSLLLYLTLGLLLTVVESLMPQALPVKPNLLLLLVLTLGLREGIAVGGPTAWLLGCLQDSLSGACLGLYGWVFLLLYLMLRSIAGLLNGESPVLLMFLVFAGTLLQAVVLVITLDMLAAHGTYWRPILAGLPAQWLLNLLAAAVFLQLSAWGRRLRQGGRWF